MRSRVMLVGIVVLAVALAAPLVLGHGPVDGRLGRAELRFMEGMIDHHQMALDMAADCLARDVSAELRAECEAVVAAQQPEIEQMQAWLREWYNVDYAPMSMADMRAMYDGDVTSMMRPMMDMMDSMLQMDMPGEMRDMMNQMRGMMMMGMMHGGGTGMDMMGGGMGGMGHGGHDAQPTAVPGMRHGGHGAATPGGLYTDPPMMMGMFAGFNRLTGVDYEIAWLESMIDHHGDAIHMSERLLARGDGGHAELRQLAQAIIDAQSAEIARYEELIAALESE